MQGGLVWTPAPAERVFSADDLYVQVRERIEKVVWRGGAYYRPDWQGVARHSPRRIIDATDGVRCVLWALGQRLADHLLLRPDGELATILTAEPPAAASPPLPANVWSGVVAALEGTSGPGARSRAERARDIAAAVDALVEEGAAGGSARGAGDDPDVECDERGDRERGEHDVAEPERFFAAEARVAGPGEEALHVGERVVLERRHAERVDEHVVTVHLDEAERIERDHQRLPLDDAGRGRERLREAARRRADRDDERDRPQDQVHQRSGDGGDEAGAAAHHEDVGDVHVERGHEAVQQGEPEIAHPAPIMDARQTVHELVQRHARAEEQLDGDEADKRPAAESLQGFVHPAREREGGAGAEQGEADAGDDGRRREEREPAVPVEALEERMHVVARDPDALRAGHPQPDPPHGNPA